MQVHSLLPWHWFGSELRQWQTSLCVHMAAGKKQVMQDTLKCYQAKRQGQQAGGRGKEMGERRGAKWGQEGQVVTQTSLQGKALLHTLAVCHQIHWLLEHRCGTLLLRLQSLEHQMWLTKDVPKVWKHGSQKGSQKDVGTTKGSPDKPVPESPQATLLVTQLRLKGFHDRRTVNLHTSIPLYASSMVDKHFTCCGFV